MKEGKASEAKSGNKGLVILLCVLVVAIVGLGVGIGVIVNFNENNKNIASSERVDELVNIDEAMPGWDGEISDSTRAMALSESVQSKLENNDGYDENDAISDYVTVYNDSSGDLKIYVAIEYAKYLCNEYGDCERAIDVLEELEGYMDESLDVMTKISWLNTVSHLYGEIGDEEMAGYYMSFVAEIDSKSKNTGGS